MEKVTLKNWSEEVLVIEKVENTVRWTCVIEDLNGEEIIGSFYEKELAKINETDFKNEQVIKRKSHKPYVKWKICVCFISGSIKKVLFKMNCFLQPYNYSKNKLKVELDLANYATKSNLKTQQVLIHPNLLNRLIGLA